MPLASYRLFIQKTWSGGNLSEVDLASLAQLQTALALTEEDAAAVEREVMGMTKSEALASGDAEVSPITPVPTASGESGAEDFTFSGPTISPGRSGGVAAPAVPTSGAKGSDDSRSSDDLEGSISGGQTLAGGSLGRTSGAVEASGAALSRS